MHRGRRTAARRALPVLVAVVCLTGCAAAGGGGAPSAPPDATPVAASASPAGPSPSPERRSDATASPSSPSPGAAPAEDRPGSPAASSVPVRLEVPAIGVAEDLIDLTITGGGSLEVPVDPDRVGWFTGGGRPGGRGPTVLVGHVDSLTGPAVFARLGELRTGDELTVTTGDGTVRYQVEEVGDVAKGAFPTEDVFGATARDEVRLITCTGWDVATRTYQGNRVVWASAIG